MVTCLMKSISRCRQVIILSLFHLFCRTPYKIICYTYFIIVPADEEKTVQGVYEAKKVQKCLKKTKKCVKYVKLYQNL